MGTVGDPAERRVPLVAVVLAVLSLGIGLLLVLPVGGADVPIVISLLNAFSGITVAASGYVLGNTLLIVAGTLAPHWLPQALNRATYLGMKGPAMMFGRTVDRWRQTTLGLPRRRGRHDPLRRPDGSPAPVLHAISRHMLPRPADWPATATMTDYWFATDTQPAPGATDRVPGRG